MVVQGDHAKRPCHIARGARLQKLNQSANRAGYRIDYNFRQRYVSEVSGKFSKSAGHGKFFEISRDLSIADPEIDRLSARYANSGSACSCERLRKVRHGKRIASSSSALKITNAVRDSRKMCWLGMYRKAGVRSYDRTRLLSSELRRALRF